MLQQKNQDRRNVILFTANVLVSLFRRLLFFLFGLGSLFVPLSFVHRLRIIIHHLLLIIVCIPFVSIKYLGRRPKPQSVGIVDLHPSFH